MNTNLFDLDGTLLPMDVEEFTKKYFGLIMQTMNENNRDGKMILDAILKGTMAMVRNDGSHTNEEVFWETFVEATQIPQDEIEPEFYDFYENVFDKINSGVQSQNMIKAAKLLKEKGYRLYLTTNPLFPRVATLKRVRWAGLDPDDFEWITTYENSSFSKPSVNYYQEVIQGQHLDVNQCMMVGNDVKEDGVIETLGIPLYLVEDYMLNHDNLEIKCRWKGSSQDFLSFAEGLPEVK
ncbi:HAD family hydrolase [uncultured Traorella sp.]|uniref:HAD family hydrolase n=1 Tax=uncultured Traorella sp. TaxID=1929048 RepID=UPI0025E5A5F4|nr:HAD family hydrolase [uncultured Traorella sp.]